MKKLITLISCLGISALMVACGDTVNSEKEASVQQKSLAPSSSSSEVEKYVDDDIVNEFITAYNALSSSKLSNIEKGNIRTKFFAESQGYYLELLNAADTNKIHISINPTNETKENGLSGMAEIFHDVVKAVDQSLSDEEIDRSFQESIEKNVMVNQMLGSINIEVIPDLYNSGGRIDISAQ
ncbi:hypothetical protein [Streptococcus marmotae]|uniref:hypothetical protein n=1 Tax=Streptococcus marmotae TaxID=1825069 RepID=UPI000833AEF6|nr:hypothetical protein [Streptococcus marmotae]